MSKPYKARFDAVMAKIDCGESPHIAGAFVDFLNYAIGDAKIKDHFCEVTGIRFSDGKKLSPIEMMIDEATGFKPDDPSDENLIKFIEFVAEYYWGWADAE